MTVMLNDVILSYQDGKEMPAHLRERPLSVHKKVVGLAECLGGSVALAEHSRTDAP